MSVCDADHLVSSTQSPSTISCLIHFEQKNLIVSILLRNVVNPFGDYRSEIVIAIGAFVYEIVRHLNRSWCIHNGGSLGTWVDRANHLLNEIIKKLYWFTNIFYWSTIFNAKTYGAYKWNSIQSKFRFYLVFLVASVRLHKYFTFRKCEQNRAKSDFHKAMITEHERHQQHHIDSVSRWDDDSKFYVYIFFFSQILICWGRRIFYSKINFRAEMLLCSMFNALLCFSPQNKQIAKPLSI